MLRGKDIMEELYELSQEQLDIRNDIMDTTNQIGFCFMDAKYRCIGKSTILRDIGLEYQALGYNVYIATPRHMRQEYIATDALTPADYGRYIPCNSVVLVDELYIEDTDWIVGWCLERKLPLMGFVRFRK